MGKERLYIHRGLATRIEQHPTPPHATLDDVKVLQLSEGDGSSFHLVLKPYRVIFGGVRTYSRDTGFDILRLANMPSERKVVLITGATGGIGAATAIAFARTGQYDLALHYNNASQEKRDALRSTIEASAPAFDPRTGTPIPSKPRLEFYQADMSDFASVRALHAAITQTYPHIDVLFNNAGSALGHQGVASLASVPIDVFEATWRVNTGSAILLTQLCLPAMEAQGWGRVVFDSSVAALTGGSVGPHYASSKSGLHGFVHWLAGNVAGKGVTVNAVAPALVTGTGMMGEEGGEVARRMAGRIPVGRTGRPEEIADTVLWMVNTAYVTNKIITVDGGLYPC
ncbi:hypothetical protein LTR91_008459 [Friedmanniomyces endolithicus]|uniref:Uncharacterized protein n=3 Tax=Dothideomycetidae TaxID=451867 RepID=A0AAN6KPG0_9PEZI|nr:hypothetical protein LTR38_012370 [Friedmanniomyces endolithicus]KAK0804323.1 hypothetical protein LTR75_007638 [Friedmanniomyces endolithicus]KAK0845122.1 hypothetical protein LTR03_007620 [Friedmanniomyces endolithicus]KAK0923489.1 hypothetical protein LTR57_006678 [Friedmanniomyces endolithicus]KAK0991837.1 hypothetical protein LTR91_008459 [Friedmanniomyces endolithicus]